MLVNKYGNIDNRHEKDSILLGYLIKLRSWYCWSRL